MKKRTTLPALTTLLLAHTLSACFNTGAHAALYTQPPISLQAH